MKLVKPTLLACLSALPFTAATAADLAPGYTIGSSQLSPNGETLFIDNAATGGGDAQEASGVLPWVAEVKALWSPGDEVTLTGIAFAMPGVFTVNGTLTVTFSGLGTNDTFDGAANETVHGSATAALTLDGASAYYVNFDTPITFTADSTGLAVHLANTAALRVKVNVATNAPGVVRRNRTTGALIGGANPNFRLSLAGTVTPQPALVWHGGANNHWDTTSLNWNDGTSTYADGIRTIFDESASSASPALIQLTAARSPLSLEIDNEFLDYVFEGSPISGTATLTKKGNGFLTLLAANSYSGGTHLSAGKLMIGDAGALGSGSLNLAGGHLHSADQTARSIANPLRITATSTLGDETGNGPLTFTGDVDFGGGGRDLIILSDITLSGSPSNGSILTKSGPATLTLTGSGSQTTSNWQIGRGDLVLDGARIQRTLGGVRIACQTPGETSRLVLTNGAVMTTTTGANIRVGSGADFFGDSSADNTLDVNGSGTFLAVANQIQLGAASLTSTVNITAGASVQLARFANSGPANKILNLDAATLIANSSTPLFLEGLDQANLLAGGLTLETDGFDITIAQPMSGTGGITKTAAGSLTLSGANSHTGPTQITGGTLLITGDQSAATGPITAATGTTLGGSGIIGGDVTFQAGATAWFIKDPATADSPLTILGTLTLADTPVRVEIPGSISLGNGTYILAAISGTTTGSFQAVPQITGAGLAPGATAAIAQTGNSVNLIVSGGTADPYQAWAGPGGFNLSGGKFDDDDHDGVPNFLEFALNGDPTAASSRGLFRSLVVDASAPAGEELVLIAAIRRGATFARNSSGAQAASQDGLVYTIEGTAALASFDLAVTHIGPSNTALPASGLTSLAGSDWEYHVFSLDASAGLSSQGFLRIAISPVP